jgi:hypothetical protein
MEKESAQLSLTKREVSSLTGDFRAHCRQELNIPAQHKRMRMHSELVDAFPSSDLWVIFHDWSNATPPLGPRPCERLVLPR